MAESHRHVMLRESNQTLKTTYLCDFTSTEALYEGESQNLGPVERPGTKAKKGMVASLGDNQAL